MITKILFEQTIIMFLLMLLGYVLARVGMLTEQGSRDLSNVLLYAVIPCVILRSYMTEYSAEKLYALGLSAVVAVIAFVFYDVVMTRLISAYLSVLRPRYLSKLFK